MTASQLRVEIFELTLKRELSDDLAEVVEVEMEIQGKIDSLINLTGLARETIGDILDRQFMEWLRERGHGLDEEGAKL